MEEGRGVSGDSPSNTESNGQASEAQEKKMMNGWSAVGDPGADRLQSLRA